MVELAQGDRPRLSAAMILKNEERRLPACLESVRGIVDEIVVVDTGSTDRTCEIAAAHGARIFHHPWQGDFSLHRNQSLDYATGDWVLIIDGDEVLSPGNLRPLLEAVHGDPAVDALSVRVDAVGPGGPRRRPGGPSNHFQPVRAFRRQVGRYRYPVHNQLEGIRAVRRSSGVITAYYDDKEGKAARSLPLLLAMAEEPTTRTHAAFFLAMTYRSLGRHADLRTWTAELRRLAPAHAGYALFWVWEIEAALLFQGLDAAEATLSEALRHHPNFAELHRFRVALAMERWRALVSKPTAYDASTVSAARYVAAIPAAADALGLPLTFR